MISFRMVQIFHNYKNALEILLTFGTSVQLEPHSDMRLPRLYLNPDATSDNWFKENMSLWKNLLCIALDDLRLNHKNDVGLMLRGAFLSRSMWQISKELKYLPSL